MLITSPSSDHPTQATPDRVTPARAGSPSPPSIAPGVTAIVFTGAIFGLFYAWVCTTMWGLDDADPRVAIEAMQAMNASVRNGVFAPAFFGTPFVLGYAALAARRDGRGNSARLFGAGAVVYLIGGLVLTMVANVPMNENLAAVVVPDSLQAAEAVWNDYSPTWQLFNTIRTVACGISLVLAAIGLARLRR